jgi:RNA polymerase sigma-70 factor (ECF subfamily)
VNEVTDEELLVLMKADVEFGVQAAIALYGSAVKKICCTILSGYSSQDIEETVADCFVEFWKSIHNFDVEKNCSLKSYLYGISKRCALNKKRRLARDRQTAYEDTVFANIQDHRADQEFEVFMNKEVVDDLIEHMDELNRKIFHYRYYDEMSVGEIAQQMKMTEKSVEGRLLRGKKKLRKVLIENDYYF